MEAYTRIYMDNFGAVCPSFAHTHGQTTQILQCCGNSRTLNFRGF